MTRRPGPSGFSLLELLTVIAILAIVALLLIPSFLDALQKAKQKQTMRHITTVGTAMMSMLTDEAGAAAAAGATAAPIDLTTIPPVSREDLTEILVPAYLQRIPALDGWGGALEYRFREENPQGSRVLGIRSLGRDGQAEGESYLPGSFDPTDYDRDLVWVDGGFIRFPLRASS